MLGTVLGGTNASDSWRRFMGMSGSANLRQQWGLDLTQLMYTPEQKATYPIYNQHPYVGNLTLGLTSLVKNEDRANSLELQLGTTGTNSLAKGSQHFIHKLWGMEQWPGWANQLPGEMTANLFSSGITACADWRSATAPVLKRMPWLTGMRTPAQ